MQAARVDDKAHQRPSPCRVSFSLFPIISGGLSVTYYGAPASADDPRGKCPPDPLTLSPQGRRVTFKFLCGAALGPQLTVINASEVAPCAYEIVASSSVFCACAPQCGSPAAGDARQCGSDGCGGYCSGPDLAGECPYVYYNPGDGVQPTYSQGVCDYTSGLCDRCDCYNRNCGDNGCGGSCGTCGPGLTCQKDRCVPVTEWGVGTVARV